MKITNLLYIDGYGYEVVIDSLCLHVEFPGVDLVTSHELVLFYQFSQVKQLSKDR